MINMVKADLYRIFRSLGIYIGIALMLIMLGTSLFLCEPGTISMNVTVNGEEIVEELKTPLDVMLESGEITYDDVKNYTVMDLRETALKSDGYQLDRDIVRVNMNLYYIFLFVIVLVISSDFSNMTIKNTLSSAISKRKYFISKLLTAYGLCLVIMFANTYICYFGNLLMNGENLSSSIGMMTKITFRQIPVMIALISIVTGIAFIVKKTAVFNVISITFGIVYSVIFSTLLKIFNLSPNNMKYEFSGMLNNMAISPKTDYMTECYVICGIVSVVFILAGWLSFRKSEIK